MITIQDLFWLIPSASVLALIFAGIFFYRMKAQDEGNEVMKMIARHVRSGAMAYLRQQYKIVAIFFVLITVVFAFLAYCLHIQNPWVPFAFISGGFFSGLAGYIGMKTATYASGRVANACRHSLDAGLQIAFRSGAVLGLTVVGLAMLDIGAWYWVLNWFYGDMELSMRLVVITTTMLTFGMGASLQALFARVGGGIFTKAADVGADLVGKVEAGIPEDDPRNPATIADNVGDNVGDVAGMGADLYESYCGSILASAALGAAAYMAVPEMAIKAVLTPMLIAALGTILSLLGVYAVRVKRGASQTELMAALNRGINLSSFLIAIASAFLLQLIGLDNWAGIWGAIVTGLAVGIVIGKSTEHYTSHDSYPCRKIAHSAKTGPATVIISGIGIGMISTCIPVITVVVGTVLAYGLASGDWHFTGAEMSKGLYGIGIAAVGMLSTLGLTLATDAYGPISDNAGGNAEMSKLDPEVRRRTDALDALGNTTAATGKGFAIGSAALTALALLASYIEELKISLEGDIEGLQEQNMEIRAANNEIAVELTLSREQAAGMSEDLKILDKRNNQLVSRLFQLAPAGFVAENFKVSAMQKNAKITTKAGRANEIMVTFDIKNVPVEYQVDEELYLVITHFDGNPVPEMEARSVKIKSPSPIDVSAVDVEQIRLSDRQSVQMSFSPAKKLEGGLYNALVYADHGFLGATSFELR